MPKTKTFRDREAARRWLLQSANFIEARSRFFALLGELGERKGAGSDDKLGDIITEDEARECFKQAAAEHKMPLGELQKWMKLDYREIEERQIEAAKMLGITEAGLRKIGRVN